MKIFSFLFVVLLPAVVGAANLRHDDNKLPAPEEISATPRAAPAEHSARSFSALHREASRRRLQATIEPSINIIVEAALPDINSVITPNPVPINKSFQSDLATPSTSPNCNGDTISISTTMTETQFFSFSIGTLELVSGTAFTKPSDCLTTAKWGGDFRFVMPSIGYNVLGSTTFTSSTGSCASLTTDSTGTLGTGFEGVISLEGTTECDQTDITASEVKEITIFNAGNPTLSTNLFGTDFESAIAEFESAVVTELETIASTEIPAIVQASLNGLVDNAVTTYGFVEGVPYVLAFAKAGAAQAVANWRDTAKQQVANLAGRLNLNIGGPGGE